MLLEQLCNKSRILAKSYKKKVNSFQFTEHDLMRGRHQILKVLAIFDGIRRAPKHQAPNTKLQRSSKSQAPNQGPRDVVAI
jgi:hypothetical protein